MPFLHLRPMNSSLDGQEKHFDFGTWSLVTLGIVMISGMVHFLFVATFADGFWMGPIDICGMGEGPSAVDAARAEAIIGSMIVWIVAAFCSVPITNYLCGSSKTPQNGRKCGHVTKEKKTNPQ